MADIYTKAMFGQNAVHVPAWLKIQDMGTSGVLFVGASRTQELRYGSQRTHQLIIGEIIIRPHVVVASDDFRGYGIRGLATECDMDKWKKGDIILDPMNKISTLKI